MPGTSVPSTMPPAPSPSSCPIMSGTQSQLIRLLRSALLLETLLIAPARPRIHLNPTPTTLRLL
jgi:hypothetical protein